MRLFLRALVVVALACTTAAASAGQTGGAEELQRFSGTWTSSGALLDTPYSKAGAATGTTTCAWSDDRLFMICQQRVSINGTLTRALSVYTYDAAQRQYHFYHMSSSGGSDSSIAVEDNRITYSDSFTDKGARITIRTLNVWETANFYRWQTDYSNNGGATWVPMASGTSQR